MGWDLLAGYASSSSSDDAPRMREENDGCGKTGRAAADDESNDFDGDVKSGNIEGEDGGGTTKRTRHDGFESEMAEGRGWRGRTRRRTRRRRRRRCGLDEPKYQHHDDGDEYRDAFEWHPPSVGEGNRESSNFVRDSPHWDGRWVGHLYLPLDCDYDHNIDIDDDDDDDDDHDDEYPENHDDDGDADDGDDSSSASVDECDGHEDDVIALSQSSSHAFLPAARELIRIWASLLRGDNDDDILMDGRRCDDDGRILKLPIKSKF